MLRVFLMQLKEIVRVFGNKDQGIAGRILKVNVICPAGDAGLVRNGDMVAGGLE